MPADGSAVSADLFSSIFDLPLQENIPAYGVVSVIVAVALTMACLKRSKNIRNK
jgi:hypothetical protein